MSKQRAGAAGHNSTTNSRQCGGGHTPAAQCSVSAPTSRRRPTSNTRMVSSAEPLANSTGPRGRDGAAKAKARRGAPPSVEAKAKAVRRRVGPLSGARSQPISPPPYVPAQICIMTKRLAIKLLAPRNLYNCAHFSVRHFYAALRHSVDMPHTKQTACVRHQPAPSRSEYRST